MNPHAHLPIFISATSIASPFIFCRMINGGVSVAYMAAWLYYRYHPVINLSSNFLVVYSAVTRHTCMADTSPPRYSIHIALFCLLPRLLFHRLYYTSKLLALNIFTLPSEVPFRHKYSFLSFLVLPSTSLALHSVRSYHEHNINWQSSCPRSAEDRPLAVGLR